MLRVRVDGTDDVRARFRAWGEGSLDVRDAADVALVVAVAPRHAGSVDVVLVDDGSLDRQVHGLVTDRLLPWARSLDAGVFRAGPATLRDPDPAWAPAAARRLARVRWLRAFPAERDRYEELKRALAAAHAGAADYDAYTRAKSSWITAALPRFDAWARALRGRS